VNEPHPVAPPTASAPTPWRTHVLAALATVAPEVDGTTLAGDRPLRAQMDIDSVDYLHFLIALQHATGVDIPERDYAQVATLDGLLAYLDARGASRP
jgi:acyl carrier protein